VDLVVQVGWPDRKHKILGMWETTLWLKTMNVVFRQVYRAGEVELGRINCKRV